jgi:hypothetical protein
MGWCVGASIAHVGGQVRHSDEMKWWDLIFPILGVLIGAGISTVSQWSLAKSGDTREERKELRRAAADLIGTYGLAWSALIGARKRGGGIPTGDELGYADRNVKFSYFAMCPGAEAHLEAVEANRLALKQLVSAFSADDPTWKRADREMLLAQEFAQASLRSS